MAKLDFEMETSLPPEKVIAMLTDFSTRRPEVWPGLYAQEYEVYTRNETSAEVREGNQRPHVWARQRYDWSRPGIVRWEVMESNFSRPGSYQELTAVAREDGGSHIRVHWQLSPASPMGALIIAAIKLTGGAPVKASMLAAFKK